MIRLIIGITLVLVFWILFLPGSKVALDHPFWYPELLQGFWGLPSLWRELLDHGLGSFEASTLWLWPVIILYSFLNKLGVSFNISTFLIHLIPFAVIGIFGITKLFEGYKLSPLAQFIGSLVFLLNTYIILLLDGGQLNLAIAYVLLPLCFWLYQRSIKSGKLIDNISFSSSVLFLSIFDIRIVFVLVLLLLFYFAFLLLEKSSSDSKNFIFGNVKITLLTIIILIGFHAYWLLPVILSNISNLLDYGHTDQKNVVNFTTLSHALYFLQPHWHLNIFGRITPILSEFVLLPIFAFLAPILYRKSKEITFWLFIALVSIFLTKGTQEPLGIVYQWFFDFIPGFSIFRDPSKFFFLLSLSYSTLIAFTVHKLLEWKSNLRYFAFAGIIIYLLFLLRPVYTQQMTGLFSQAPYEDKYKQLSNFLNSQENYSRVLWIPDKSTLGFSGKNHPAVLGLVLLQKRPFVAGTIGTYELYNFLREANYMGELLDVSGIQYLAFPPLDLRRDPSKPDNIAYYQQFIDQLNLLPWVNQRLNLEIPVLETKQHQKKFFAVQKVLYIVGSDDIYKEAVEKGMKFSDFAFVFLEESPSLVLDKDMIGTFVLNKKQELDLAVSFLSDKRIYFPAQNLDFDPNKTGWWKRDTKQLVSWRNFLQTKYNLDNQDFDLFGGWAVSEGDNSIELNINPTSGEKLLARVMTSPKSGEIEFLQGEERVGMVTTLDTELDKVTHKITGYGTEPDQIMEYDSANFGWYEVGILKNSLPITIKTKGQINVVNSILVVESSILDSAKNRVSQAKQDNKLYSWSEHSSDILFIDDIEKPKLVFKEVAPYHYKLMVENLTKPEFIVFSQSFDGSWKVNGNSTLPVYSLLNGFVVDQNGEYNVFFEPQRYVPIGLYITGTTIALLVFGIIIIQLKKKKYV